MLSAMFGVNNFLENAVPVKSINSFPGSKIMIEITQKAAVLLKEFLKDMKVSGTVRIFSQKSY